MEARVIPVPEGPTQVGRGLTTVNPGDQDEMGLYVETGDEVGAENRPALPGNPYAGDGTKR